MVRGSLIATVVALFASAVVALRGGPESPLRDLTDARARVVWVEDHGEKSKDTFAGGDRLRLMGLDSDDVRGPRPILESLGNYAKPLIVPDGDRVVFSNRLTRQAFVVDWEGSGLRKIADGFALDVWRDPEDDTTWVYYQQNSDGGRNSEPLPIHRLRLDDPSVDERVWNERPVSVDNFQLSKDGRKASILFPWPKGGVLDLETGELRGITKGCWVSMSPDSHGLFWIFDLPHRNLEIHPPNGGEPWTVPINHADAIDGYEVYHPRWSNHPRFLVITGPYVEGPGPNRIGGGGPAVEVHVGRFTKDFRVVEKWIQVSRSPERGSFFPDLWIEGS